MVTPLRDQDMLDVAGLERLVEHLLAGGVAGLFILGTTGEGPSLSYRLRRELIERTCKQVNGRVPVLAGITDPAFAEAVDLTHFAADAGVSAVVTAGPFYYPVSQPDLIHYIERLVAAVPLPLFLYNIPDLTKVTFAPETVRRARDLKQVIGVKDSSGDMLYFQEIVRLAVERADWSILMGPETLMAEAVLMGAHGGVNGGAMVHPRLYVDLCQAATAKDLPKVLALQEAVVDLAGHIYSQGCYSSAVVRALKCALSCMGICDDYVAEPFRRFGEHERALMRQHLLKLGLIT
jgi:dihydrodipicolinate synthase/N-acetylneuraminate lyase